MVTLKKHGFKPMTAQERAKKVKTPATCNVHYLSKPAKRS
jgi:hypothetical protein